MTTSITKTDLSRRFFLDVTQSGHVFIRSRGARIDGALPVYSTDTAEEAEQIRIRHCRSTRDGSGLYQLNDFGGEVDDLFAVGALFRTTHDAIKAARGP